MTYKISHQYLPTRQPV